MAAARTKAPAKRGAAAMTSAACGCGPASSSALRGSARLGGPAAVRDGVGPGAHAAGVDNALKAANLKHLRRIEGQVRGLQKMVEDDRYCADIMTQIASVHEALRSVGRELMRNHLKHCATSAIQAGSDQAEGMYDELVEMMYKHSR